MKRSRTGIVLALTLLVAGSFVCTLKNDLGNPATPGSNHSPDDTIPIIPGTEDVTVLATSDRFVGIGDTLVVTVSVVNASLHAVAGAVVTVAASVGSLSDDSLVTDANGRAQVKFRHSAAAQNVQLTFKCRKDERTIRVDVTDTPDQVQKLVEALPEKPSIKADGVDFTTIRVTVIDESHNPIAGEAVQFVSTSGVIKGTNPPSASLSGVAVTDEDGVAIAKITSSNINDTAYITAYLLSDLTMSAETRVAFQGVSLNLTADNPNLVLRGRTIVTARLLNASGIPIAFAPIYFTMGEGAGSNLSFADSAVDTITGFDGIARATVIGTDNGTDSILAAAAGARSYVRVNVTNLILKAWVNSQILQANADLADTLHVTFTDNLGAALPNRRVEVIRFYQTSAGVETSDTLTDITDAAGKCNITIHAVSWETTMRLQVTGYSSATVLASAEASIRFISTRYITMKALPTVIPADGTSESQITVQIKNRTNNPIVGDKVTFITSRGMVLNEATTDVQGKATVALTSDRRNTIATVTAWLEQDATVKDSVHVEFTGVELRASASPPSISSSGLDTSTIRVTLYDAMKNPIVGERVFFSPQKRDSTIVRVIDSVTTNRGEVVCKILGAAHGQDTVGVTAAGASTNVIIYYSSNYLTIDTTPAPSTRHSYTANGRDSTRVTITYRAGNRTTPIAGSQVEFNVTVGNLGQTFTDTLRTDVNGQAVFYIHNPDFANWATLQAKATSPTEITCASMAVYFKADLIHHIKLTGTPEVISNNGDRAKITAVVYDAQNNRVKDATIAFNLVNGPGGGERLDPPTAVTGQDGTATTYLVSGPLPSNFREVWIAAGDFSTIKSDTVRFTIAGPPAYITIRRQIGQVAKNSNGTYAKSVSALVTDVNGNPVADGTEVTFSAKITGFTVFFRAAKRIQVFGNSLYSDDFYYDYDTSIASTMLPFEDLNDNFTNDPGEDRNRDGFANRGEDRDGDGLFQVGPGFVDIDRNGYRNPPSQPPEPYIFYDRYVYTRDSTTQQWNLTIRPDSAWADFDADNQIDRIEPLRDTGMTEAEYKSFPGWSQNLFGGEGGYEDIDWNNNAVPDPQTTVIINRTVQTVGGIAVNSLVYGQSDALRIRVMLNAEAQGKVTASPEEFILPITIDDLPYWSPFDD